LTIKALVNTWKEQADILFLQTVICHLIPPLKLTFN